MLQSALFYHTEGLNVIPVVWRDKMPALAKWEEYQTRHSTQSEIKAWFSRPHNIGIIHCPLNDGRDGHYITLDIDHDAGVFDAMRGKFPALFGGRIEQSGSLEGYHVPLVIQELPDFGHNDRQGRARGNRTWKTQAGDANLRIAHCQTLVPPSVHPTGNRYRFIQKGAITQVDNLVDLIDWLNELAPPPPPRPVQVKRKAGGTSPVTSGTLVDAVKESWPDALAVFEQFGMANKRRQEQNGEIRLSGNGGLLIRSDEPALWYCFADETGGDQIHAWGWCRYGSAYDPERQFRAVLVEMAQAAGLDVAQFYRRGDEQVTRGMTVEGDRTYWSSKYQGRWGRMR
jgi:hypothetical protein